MLSHRRREVDDNETPSSFKSDSTHTTFAVALAIPLYSDSALERETTLCLEEDQDIRLDPKNKQWPPVLRRSSMDVAQSASVQQVNVKTDLVEKEIPKVGEDCLPRTYIWVMHKLT